MSNGTVIYCLSGKKDRNDIEKYLELVNLINRQIVQGAELSISGLYEAKKKFKCNPINEGFRNFIIAKGEYFLLVDGKIEDTSFWRIMRACRTMDERLNEMPATGIPEDEDVYASNENDDETTNDVDENDYFKELAVPLPNWDDENHLNLGKDNYIMMYQIKEADSDYDECTNGFTTLTKETKFNDQELKKSFQQLLPCKSKEEIMQVKNLEKLTNFCIKQHEKMFSKGKETDSHHSVVIAIIDGKTDHWRCGIWGYKNLVGEPMKFYPVDIFAPDSYFYLYGRKIPYFTSTI